MTGKWSRIGVPQKGWLCTMVEDLGAPSSICEMCEVQEIRYVHYMVHVDYDEELGVGCICAEKMEEDYVRPRRRELALKGAATRRKTWLSRKWRISAKGNEFLNIDKFNIVIFSNYNNTWGGRIEDLECAQVLMAKRQYPSPAAAKLAAFDAMIALKQKR